jgi:hypothetical protein
MLLRLSFPNEPGAVTGSVGVVKLQRGGARFRTPPGRGIVVKVRLRTAARRALASAARARVVVTIRARDTAGNTSVTRRRIKLRAP